jgi:hypothetical protein
MAKTFFLAKSFHRYCVLNLFAIMERRGIWPAGYLAGYSPRASAGFAPPSAENG